MRFQYTEVLGSPIRPPDPEVSFPRRAQTKVDPRVATGAVALVGLVTPPLDSGLGLEA